MERARTRPRHEAIDRDYLLVHEWRVAQFTRLGIPWPDHDGRLAVVGPEQLRIDAATRRLITPVRALRSASAT
jgi:hypothetical protein